MDAQTAAPVQPPRGTFQARCDEKGRLKLPANFVKYLGKLGEDVVFITTLDCRIARIYPISNWQQTEEFFQSFRDNPQAAQQVSMVANHYGADSEIDGQGRVLVPTLLRRELGLEGQTVWIQHYRGRFNVMSDALYQEQLAAAKGSLPENVALLEQGGML